LLCATVAALVTRKRLISTAGIAALGAIAIAVAAVMMWNKSAPPPNVVVIIIDTLRQDKLSAYGFPEETSPEIDRMAAQGVRFDRVIAQSSWTRPSIGSMLTSHYPRTLGIYKERDEILPDKFVTLAEVLQEAGWTTIGATANPNLNTSFNFQQGFDHYIDSNVLFGWMDGAKVAKGKRRAPLLSAREIFDSLIAEVKERKTRPYYLQANVMEVHEPQDRRIDLSKYEPQFGEGPHRRYMAAIRLLSAEIDRFAKVLSTLPGFERTLFVIVSDHGEGLDDHSPVKASNKHGLLLYQSQVLVPLILYATDDSLPRGQVIEARSRLLDLMPTLLDYLGLVAPPGIVGKSMMPYLNGSGPPELPSRFVVETQFREADAIGVYAPKWEYFEHRVSHPGTDPRELQRNGANERGTTTNQIESHPELGDDRRAFLQQWEAKHAKAKPTKRGAPLPALETEQLRALGYID
jgi:arylsulfatase A-like enzyme